MLSTRLVLTEKEVRKKARLVVRGFEDPECDTVIKDSPTCSKEAFRILLFSAHIFIYGYGKSCSPQSFFPNSAISLQKHVNKHVNKYEE